MAKHESQAAVARRLGVAKSTISGWFSGDRGSGVSVDDIEVYAAKLGLDVQKHLKAQAFAERKSDALDLSGGYVFVDKAVARPSAGGGSLETSGDVIDSFAFKAEWLARRGCSPATSRILEVSGDSMAPAIADGDHILVNQQDQELKDGKVYVLRVDNEIFIKRFFRAKGKYLFRSDNREMDYTDLEIEPNGRNHWRVVGRVIWVGKEI
jgi:phage repressor protein C with HTH and peptisase S24 domain